MKQFIVILATLGLVGLTATPAAGLSCAEPEPVDWSTRLPAADASVIGVLESVEEIEGEEYARELLLQARVTERLGGRTISDIEYRVPYFDPWGPHYEVGQEIAIVIENGVVTDGQMHICGPWFTPDELRQAADEYGPANDPTPSTIDFLRLLLERMIRLLFHWT